MVAFSVEDSIHLNMRFKRKQRVETSNCTFSSNGRSLQWFILNQTQNLLFIFEMLGCFIAHSMLHYLLLLLFLLQLLLNCFHFINSMFYSKTRWPVGCLPHIKFIFLYEAAMVPNCLYVEVSKDLMLKIKPTLLKFNKSWSLENYFQYPMEQFEIEFALKKKGNPNLVKISLLFSRLTLSFHKPNIEKTIRKKLFTTLWQRLWLKK